MSTVVVVTLFAVSVTVPGCTIVPLLVVPVMTWLVVVPYWLVAITSKSYVTPGVKPVMLSGLADPAATLVNCALLLLTLSYAT